MLRSLFSVFTVDPFDATNRRSGKASIKTFGMAQVFILDWRRAFQIRNFYVKGNKKNSQTAFGCGSCCGKYFGALIRINSIIVPYAPSTAILLLWDILPCDPQFLCALINCHTSHFPFLSFPHFFLTWYLYVTYHNSFSLCSLYSLTSLH